MKIWSSGQKPDRSGIYKEVPIIINPGTRKRRVSMYERTGKPRRVRIDLQNKNPGTMDRLPPTRQKGRGWVFDKLL